MGSGLIRIFQNYFFRNYVFVICGGALGAISSILIRWFLSKYLSVEDFGVFALMLASVSLSASIAGFGLPVFLLNAFGREGWAAVKWVRQSIFLIIALVALLVAMALVATWFTRQPFLPSHVIFIFFPILLAQVSWELISAKLQIEGKFKRLALWQLVPNFLRLIGVQVLTLLVFEESGSWVNVGYMYGIVSLLVLFSTAVQLNSFMIGKIPLGGYELEAKGHKYQDLQSLHFLNIVKKASPYGLGNLFYLLLTQSSVVIIFFLLGAHSAGTYSAATIIIYGIYLIPNTLFQQVLMSRIQRWAYHDFDRYKILYNFTSKLMLLIGSILMILVLAFSESINLYLFDESYKGLTDVLVVLAFAIPFRFIASSAGAYLTTKNYMKSKLRILFLVSILHLILTLLLTWWLQLTGAAIAFVLCEIFFVVLYRQKLSSLQPLLKSRAY